MESFQLPASTYRLIDIELFREGRTARFCMPKVEFAGTVAGSAGF
jgi:hypothetical protein